MAENCVFGPKIYGFGPFWSGNSNTPDELQKVLLKKACKTVLVDSFAATLGHF